MAVVDNVTELEIPPTGMEIVRAQLTGATSTYVARKLANVQMCFVDVEGTNGATFTRSTITVTITGTNDDWVNIILIGQK